MTDIAIEIPNHDELIREVFIDPIRTVIVVDDEYPTLDSLTAKELSVEGGWKGEEKDVQRVRDLLEFARTKDRPWLVDVHDGKKIGAATEEVIAPYLHHSDLLVLDYNLDSIGVKGGAAINILRRLAQNDHFNLVIVHTNENNLETVIRGIALGLSYPDPALCFADEEEKSLGEDLEQWEDEAEGITLQLDNEISEETYLQARTKYTDNYAGILGATEGKRIIDLWKNRPKQVQLDTKQLAKLLLFRKQVSLTKQLSPEDFGNVQVGHSDAINWIRTDRLFITVLSKRCSPDSFESKLLEAIRTSCPSPHRLLLAKMRSEIDQRGVVAEAAILGNRHIQAEWLSDFLNPDPVDPKGVIYNTIDQHWEALGDQLRSALSSFAERLYQYFASLDKDDVMNGCGFSNTDVGSTDALMSFNCFTSTKPIDRSHLTTGHIFSISGEEQSLWACLTPACDMVPDRPLPPGLTDCRPFVAVQLNRIDKAMALKNATKNIFLFLRINGELEAFSIHKRGDMTANPVWKQMFARANGRFHGDSKLNVGWIAQRDGELSISWSEVSTVAQLRSEYALNLLQRIGVFLSRPGLGINFKSRQA
ncbi:MAG: hypothetical protein C0392_04020 [Syntrophus sp. (in: bacteria)]|nr:hypothetical protein [Syntrophus sp. (in: bacteria)]